MAKARRDIAQEITDKFIAAIEDGIGDGTWTRPWTLLGELPTNIDTGKQYRGMNFLLLMWAGGGMWGTYKQWKNRDAQVRKGEKSQTIIRPLMGKDKTTGDTTIFGWAGASVFHSSQVDGYEAPEVDTARQFIPLQRVEEVVADTGASIRHGGDKAFYVPSMDHIQMPTPEQFDSEEAYYSTLLHELGHWTGHKDRLDRTLNTTRFGTDAYAFEELVAELSSAFLSAELGVHVGFQENHAKYLAMWLNIMKGDKNAVISAASLAQKVVDYIIPAAKVEATEDTKQAA